MFILVVLVQQQLYIEFWDACPVAPIYKIIKAWSLQFTHFITIFTISDFMRMRKSDFTRHPGQSQHTVSGTTHTRAGKSPYWVQNSNWTYKVSAKAMLPSAAVLQLQLLCMCVLWLILLQGDAMSYFSEGQYMNKTCGKGPEISVCGRTCVSFSTQEVSVKRNNVP